MSLHKFAYRMSNPSAVFRFEEALVENIFYDPLKDDLRSLKKCDGSRGTLTSAPSPPEAK